MCKKERNIYMNCPYCGNEMIQGKVCSNEALWWKQDAVDNICLNDEGSFLSKINGYRITAFKCDNCKKIIIDTNK